MASFWNLSITDGGSRMSATESGPTLDISPSDMYPTATDSEQYQSTSGWQDTEGHSTEDLIILIGTPIIFVLGILGNCLSAIVMKRRHFRALSTGAYLFSLALVDSLFLGVNSMTKNFIRLLTGGVDLTKLSDWSCKLYVFLLMTSKCLSAWLIVAVTVERLIIVCIPHRAKVLATRRRAWLAIMGVTLAICALHILVLVTYGLVARPWGWDCTMLVYYNDKGLRLLLTIIDLVSYSLLPAITLFVANVILVYKLMRSRSFRQATQGGASSADDVTRLTVTLVAVSVTFLVCTSPNSLMFLIKTVDSSITEQIPNYPLLYRSFYLLQLSNSAINFVLYCLSGPAFRKEVSLFCPCPCPEDPPKKQTVKVNFKPQSQKQKYIQKETGQESATSDAVSRESTDITTTTQF